MFEFWRSTLKSNWLGHQSLLVLPFSLVISLADSTTDVEDADEPICGISSVDAVMVSLSFVALLMWNGHWEISPDLSWALSEKAIKRVLNSKEYFMVQGIVFSLLLV